MTTNHPQAEGTRRCASPLCRKMLPADASARRRYCSGACRQAAWRIDNPVAVPAPVRPRPHDLAALEDDVRRRAVHLAVHAQHIADPLASTGKQAVALRTLPALVDDLLAAHVAVRRAAGDTWEWIGQTLTMHPDTVRRRFGRSQADADADVGRGEELGEEAGPAPDAAAPSSARESALEEPAVRTDRARPRPRPSTAARPSLRRPAKASLGRARQSFHQQRRRLGRSRPRRCRTCTWRAWTARTVSSWSNEARVAWLHAAAPGGWQIHDRDGQLVTTLPADTAHGLNVGIGLNLAQLAAAALGIGGADRAAMAVGPLQDDRGRTMDTSPAALASWSLLKGREPGRTDVIVRSRCVGWLQRDSRGRDVACTLDGPVPGSASTNRVQAVTALLAALVAPAPLPELGPEARAARRPRARSPRERPICPFTPAQLAAAALADNLPRLADGSYRVHIHDGYDDTELGRVYRSGRRWQALDPNGRVVVHRADTRTEAVDQLLATPGPLFGDPADTVLHDL
ncbi:hypothetical protein ACIBI9_49045 [Nonomuraea sp. NPDC050451]|uniref:hypothetical protein n=1 Tax=Nonomuraea sp. NPDC050451 TaxID=3364364 RepID=UPI00378AC897